MNALPKLEDISRPQKTGNAGQMNSPFGKIRRVRIANGVAVDLAHDQLTEAEPAQEISSEPAVNIEDLVEKAVQKERDAAAIRQENALLDQKAAFVESIKLARQAWVAEESSAISAALEAAIADMQQSIEDKLGDVLAPFVTERFCAQAISEVADLIRSAVNTESELNVCVAGPGDLVQAISTSLSGIITLNVKDNTEPEVTAYVNDAMIETRFTEWGAKLKNQMSS